jgi:hypothetical protein
MFQRLYIILTLFTFYACVKDKPDPARQQPVQLSNSKKVYIVNEGNFMAGNSSVSLFDPGTSEVIENFYNTQNGTALGDVAQSIAHYNSNYYIVVNNSNKIVVCDEQFKTKATISGFTSPRYILPVSNSKAYVSDLYANAIRVVNLNQNTAGASIPCIGWTEEMVLLYNKVFVTNKKRDYVFVINAASDTKEDSIYVGYNSGSIVTDKYDKIWVLSAGNASAAVLPSLKRIDPLTNTVEKTITFTSTDAPSNLCLNKTKDTLYFLNKDIYRMEITATVPPGAAFIARGNKTFYGLGVNKNDHTVYASDALDYIQRSHIYIYDAAGNPKSSFKAGINANSFYFE